MDTQYSNIDIPRWPQKVRIEWTMLTPQDDSSDRPDERDDGFWPSRNPDAAGYVRPEGYEQAAFDAQARMEAWKAGDWHFVGVVAEALVFVPIGGTAFRVIKLQSGGCWGIESDAGDYLHEVYKEEKSNLLDELKTMGAALAAGDFIEA